MRTTRYPTITLSRRVVSSPARQPLHTSHSVAYELGKCFQLDKENILLAASMDEQGGGDLCVGNDAFIFSRLSDIRQEQAIPVNAPDPAYRLKSGGKTAYMSKFPLTGNFIPLGVKTAGGRPHPAAGAGLFISAGMTFNVDRSSAGAESELALEFMQVQWDGTNFTVSQRDFCDMLLGHQLVGVCLSYFLIDGDGFLAPLTTKQGTVVFRFEFAAGQWRAVACGRPFLTHQPPGDVPLANLIGETEPSIQKMGHQYYIYTRGMDAVGRLYRSYDGLNYELVTQRFNSNVPQSLNKGLDGSLYIATNPNMDWLRNPLVVYPLVEHSFDIPNYTGEPVIIHDQDGVRDCSGASIPFVDHGVGVNLFLEGSWRHLLWYRVCDLKERTPHACQPDLKAMLGEAQSRATFGGLYVCELTWPRYGELPYAFA